MHFTRLATLIGLGLSSVFAADIDMEGLPDTGLNTTSWVTGQLPSLDDIVDLNDMQIAAKNTLTKRWYGEWRKQISTVIFA